MERLTVGFRPGSLLPRLSERSSKAEGPGLAYISKRDLERLYAMLPAFLRSVQLTPPALDALLELYPLAWPEGMLPALIQLLPSAVEHEMAQHRDLAERAEQARLIEQLAALNPGERLALVDAIERALLLIEAGADQRQALKQVGL